MLLFHTFQSADEVERKGNSSAALQVPFLTTWGPYGQELSGIHQMQQCFTAYGGIITKVELLSQLPFAFQLLGPQCHDSSQLPKDFLFCCQKLSAHAHWLQTHRQTLSTGNDSSSLFAALSKAQPLISTNKQAEGRTDATKCIISLLRARWI